MSVSVRPKPPCHAYHPDMTDTANPFPRGPLYRLTDLWPKSEDELDQALEAMGDLYAQQDGQAAGPEGIQPPDAST